MIELLPLKVYLFSLYLQLFLSGPVVQSVVSLMNSFVEDSVRFTALIDLIVVIFFARNCE